jgi:A/G-specific adenine glycosylase
VARVALATPVPAGMRFTPRSALDDEPLPGLMRKVLAHAFDPKPEPEAKPRGRPRKEPPPMPLLAAMEAPVSMPDPDPRPRVRAVPKPQPRPAPAPPPEADDLHEGEVEPPATPTSPRRRGPARRRP